MPKKYALLINNIFKTLNTNILENNILGWIKNKILILGNLKNVYLIKCSTIEVFLSIFYLFHDGSIDAHYRAKVDYLCNIRFRKM